MHYQDHVAVHSHRVEPGIQVPLVIGKTVGPVRREPGIAHAHTIRREAASVRQQVRDDVAPNIRRRGIVVQEDDGVSPSPAST